MIISALKIQRRTKGFLRRKTFYSMDDNCSNESSEYEDIEVLLMGIEKKIPKEEVEGVVDLEA